MRYIAIEKDKFHEEREARQHYIVAYSFELGREEALRQVKHTCRNAINVNRGGNLLYPNGVELYVDSGDKLTFVAGFSKSN